MPTNVLVLNQLVPPPQAIAGEPAPSGRLPMRLALAGVVFGAETCIVAALGHPWVHTLQISTAPILFVAALLFFGRKQLQSAPLDITTDPSRSRILCFFTLHVAALVAMLALDRELHLAFARHRAVSPVYFAAWCLALLVMAFTLLAMAVAPRALVVLSRQLGIVWLYAAACAFLGLFLRSLEYLAWNAPHSWLGNHLAASAFNGVQFLLGLFYPYVYTDPAARIIGTPIFLIRVAGTCSGIEGLSLTLVLALGWILYERKHLRVIRALLLVPIALVLIWCLNLVRMTALIAIGNAGYPKLALTGFHTEAGWIAFTLVAIAFLLVANQIAWFQKPENIPADAAFSSANAPQPSASAPSIVRDNTAVAYILPFVAILAVSLFTRIFDTNGFEVFYPVRLFVLAAILFVFRKQYSSISWRVRPLDFVVGAAIGILWIFLAPHGNSALTANGLASLSQPSRIFWLSARVLAAIITVPIAEELAFRGFLARRVMAERFETVRYASLTLIAIAVSSVAFGVMHGSLWILGTLSGIVFALVARRRNSLGAAIAAHATANLALAIAAIAFGRYFLW